MIPNRPNRENHLLRPALALVAGLGLAVGLMLLPKRYADTARGLAGTALRPAQRAVFTARNAAGRAASGLGAYHRTAARLADAEQEVQTLEQENRRLSAELAVAKAAGPVPASGSENDRLDPLLVTRCVPAVVLGHQARAFLARHHLLDVGAGSGVEPGALVVDAPCELLDQGETAGIEPGQLVLAGSRVWGKVVEVGPHTATVRTLTEPGYRDLVRLGSSGPRGLVRLGPRGLLEGTGEPLARIRQIEVTEPVAVGDVVFTAGAAGVLPQPLVCGRVVRVERPTGAAHWDIWVELAVGAGEPDRVAVLRTELNPARVAQGEW
jgi:rod shape-determining protein MreC